MNTDYIVYFVYKSNTFSFKTTEGFALGILRLFKEFKLQGESCMIHDTNFCFDFTDCMGVYIGEYVPTAQERIAAAQEQAIQNKKRKKEKDDADFWKGDDDEE